MRICLYGRNLDYLQELLKDFPFEIVDKDPEIVISYGGDGSLLGAEREFPTVTKLPLRDKKENPKCEFHDELLVLQALAENRLKTTKLLRLEAETENGNIVTGLNDILVNKRNISSGIRFRLWIDDELYCNQIVGDGLVVAAPFGSTGYYRTITKSLFRTGFGVAFNNSTEPIDHLVIDEKSILTVEVLRGPAVLLADNSPTRFALEKGQKVTIRQSAKTVKILGLDIFRCRTCFKLRQDSI